MNLPRTPLRIAIAQPAMHRDGDANTQSILDTIAQAAAAGARLCVFPELAVTGFHRQIASQAKPDLVAAWLQVVQQACAVHAVAVSVGAPSFDDDGRIFNSQFHFDEQGQLVGMVEKKGLTEPEATFFAHGRVRPVFSLCGLRCTAVICREIEDLEEVCAQLVGAQPEFVFWPGLMGPEAGTEHIEPPRHVQQAQALARRLGAWVVQANWPMSLNHPELGAKTGRSVVIGPAGELMFELPRAACGVAVFELGASSCDWQPQDRADPIS